MNRAEIETPGDRSDGDQYQAGRNGFGLRAGRREQGDEIAGLGAAGLHLRKQHGRHGGHVGGLRARNARHQIHRADQHVMQTAADMAEQAGQERHHRARHAGHFDQQPQEHEQRHRQQDQMAHALVHAADQHHQRRMRGQRQIAEDRQTKSEGDRHAGKHAKAGDADKEDDEIDIAERPQPGLRQPEHRDHQRDRQHRADHDLDVADPRQPQESEQRHQGNPDRQRRGAPDVGDLQRRRGDEAFFVGVVVGRLDRPAAGTPARRRSRPHRDRPASRAWRWRRSRSSRMCSERRNATAAPSMASHRNRIEASSSDQISGLRRP